MSRSRGATSVDDAVADADEPDVIASSPARQRSAVVLPQPDGPTSTMNSPSAISSESSFDGRHLAEALRPPVEVTAAISPSPPR